MGEAGKFHRERRISLMKFTLMFLMLNVLISFSSFSADKKGKEGPKEVSRFEQLELFNKVLFQIEG